MYVENERNKKNKAVGRQKRKRVGGGHNGVKMEKEEGRE